MCIRDRSTSNEKKKKMKGGFGTQTSMNCVCTIPDKISDVSIATNTADAVSNTVALTSNTVSTTTPVGATATPIATQPTLIAPPLPIVNSKIVETFWGGGGKKKIVKKTKKYKKKSVKPGKKGKKTLFKEYIDKKYSKEQLIKKCKSLGIKIITKKNGISKPIKKETLINKLVSLKFK